VTPADEAAVEAIEAASVVLAVLPCFSPESRPEKEEEASALTTDAMSPTYGNTHGG